MADVFINYKREERGKAEALKEALVGQGLSVTYDSDLAPERSFQEWMGAELEKTSAVVTLWSPLSVQSSWVREEAFLARRMEKLLPAIIAPCEVPLGLNLIQAVDLTDWRPGDDRHPGFLALVEAIRRLAGREPLRSRNSSRRSSERETPARTVVVRDAEEVGRQVEFDAGRKYRRQGFSWRCPIFIAHAGADKVRLSPIVKILMDGGFPVWIDKPYELALADRYRKKASRIVYTGDWKEQIRKAVSRSRVVLSFWSTSSVSGDREQFQYELYMGLKQNKLRHCRIDVVGMEQIGRPYTFDHIADLSDYNAPEFHPVLDLLMADFNRRG